MLMHYKLYFANYEALFQLREESLTHVKEAEMRACIIGVQSYMKTFDFFFFFWCPHFLVSFFLVDSTA